MGRMIQVLVVMALAEAALGKGADATANADKYKEANKFPKHSTGSQIQHCFIYSAIGNTYNQWDSDPNSVPFSGKDKTPLQWVLSYNLRYDGNNKPRFDRGTPVVLQQLERDHDPSHPDDKDNLKMGQPNQMWKISEDGYIQTHFNDYAVNIEGSNTSPGGRVIMWGKYDGKNEKWWLQGTLDKENRGKGKIMTRMDGADLCLELAINRPDGKDLQIRTAVPKQGAAWQEWEVVCDNNQ